MTVDDIKRGPCYIDGQYSHIRKVNKETGIVCYFRGTFSGQTCEKVEDFLKRKYELVKKDLP